MSLEGEGFLLVLVFDVIQGVGDVHHCMVMCFGEELEEVPGCIAQLD